MIDQTRAADMTELKKRFQTEDRTCSPYIYIPITTDKELDQRDRLSRLLLEYKRSGYGGVIPYAYGKSPITALTPAYYEVYDTICALAADMDWQVGYLDDSYIMRAYLDKQDDDGAADRLKQLVKYDVSCTTGETVKRKISGHGTVMSVVAVDDDTQEIIDLRPFITDGMIEWKVPDGNWNIEQYICETDDTSPMINMMDYDVSYRYLKETFCYYLDHLYSGVEENKHLNLFIYRNVVYGGQNRRMWDDAFNRVFEEQYGMDPAVLYPLMFRDFGLGARRFTGMMMTCRASLLTEGYLKAAADICQSREIFCTGFPAESKATFCSWMFGDGQLLHKHASAPGVSVPFAYLYGINGIKVASGAADGFGKQVVSADMFKYYQQLSKDILYRETLNTLVRGVNMLFVHLGEDRTDENSKFGEKDTALLGQLFTKNTDLTEYADFTTRAQNLLRGGDHICDAAILYPIHSLHSSVFLYQSENRTGFEYPTTPASADYMELMNNLLGYVGVDAAFLHPDVLRDRAFSDEGTLYIKDAKNEVAQKYKVLFLPSMSLISLKTLRVIKKYYEAGGKIIATDSLPVRAAEGTLVDTDINTALKRDTPEDREVAETIRYIFGDESLDEKCYRRYYKNENENGGIAYYFPSNKTTVDGTDSVSANILYQALEKLSVAPDVYIDRMPRVEFSGVVNYHLPAFLKVGIDSRLARGCSMNCLHKRYAGCDLYFFTNTTGDTYEHSVLLRGRHQPEEWNPFTGKIRKLPWELVKFRGEVYTRIVPHIEPSACVFIVSPITRTQKEILRDMADEKSIPEFFPKPIY